VIAQRDYRDFLADIVGACRSLIELTALLPRVEALARQHEVKI
jgi:hypothetical protein